MFISIHQTIELAPQQVFQSASDRLRVGDKNSFMIETRIETNVEVLIPCFLWAMNTSALKIEF